MALCEHELKAAVATSTCGNCRTRAEILAQSADLPAECTCDISTITLRRETSSDCPVHRRVTHDSIAWEQIPEQTVCICSDPKAIHTSGQMGLWRDPAYRRTCSRSGGCRCPGFHDVDHPMPLAAFLDRLLVDFDVGAPERLVSAGPPEILVRKVKARPNLQTRARTALGWAWKQSGLALDEPRTWAIWMADSTRVWRAWRDAGSPIHVFGKPTSFGPAAILALEDR